MGLGLRMREVVENSPSGSNCIIFRSFWHELFAACLASLVAATSWMFEARARRIGVCQNRPVTTRRSRASRSPAPRFSLQGEGLRPVGEAMPDGPPRTAIHGVITSLDTSGQKCDYSPLAHDGRPPT